MTYARIYDLFFSQGLVVDGKQIKIKEILGNLSMSILTTSPHPFDLPYFHSVFSQNVGCRL